MGGSMEESWLIFFSNIFGRRFSMVWVHFWMKHLPYKNGKKIIFNISWLSFSEPRIECFHWENVPTTKRFLGTRNRDHDCLWQHPGTLSGQVTVLGYIMVMIHQDLIMNHHRCDTNTTHNNNYDRDVIETLVRKKIRMMRTIAFIVMARAIMVIVIMRTIVITTITMRIPMIW